MDESTQLRRLAGRPLIGRLRGYVGLSGPGYLQSAMTLGGGSVASSVVMGSLLGYQLLWVQPLAMVLGYFLLAAVAKQTCHTGERPYKAFWERLHPAMALTWGVSALVATLIWHVPQYSLTANGVRELAGGVGLELVGALGSAFIGVAILALACGVVYLYHAGARGLRLYETAVKVLVWSIVAAFALVALATGIRWGELALGFSGISFVRGVMANGMPDGAIKPIVGGLAAAVGINMVFLYPYSLLQKKWGKEHRELAYFDLLSGMVAPFFFATSFMVIAVANTIGPGEGEIAVEAVRDIRAVVPVLGPTFGRWLGGEEAGHAMALGLIGLGMIAIGFSTIITHMLACGFIGCEIFGVEHRGRARLWFSFLPVFGVVGVAFASPWYVAITASTLAAPLLPVAVVGFLILLNRRSYMGEQMPRGGLRLFWNAMLIASILVMSVAAYLGLRANWRELGDRLHAEPSVTVQVRVDRTGAEPTGRYIVWPEIGRE